MNHLLYILYAILIFSGIMMVSCINPIHSVLFFICIFLTASFIFILLHVDFLGLAFLMVYVGAIAVLFIFVVMMLNIKRIERDNTTYLLIGGFLFLLCIMQLIYLVMDSFGIFSPSDIVLSNTIDYEWQQFVDEFGTKYVAQWIGIYIFTKYIIVLCVSGTTLLVSLIGAVYLTNSKIGYSVRRQDNQFSRNSSLLNIHVY